MRILIAVFMMTLLSQQCFAIVINIPDDFETIQAGINASEDGDTVLVAPGEYPERINFFGRDIVVGSTYLLSHDWNSVNETTVVSFERNSVVTFSNGETEDAELIGFTISSDPDEHFRCNEGGGIYCINADPTIIACKIINQSVGFRGGGIFIDGDCSVSIMDCQFLGNEAGFAGGGVYLAHGAVATFTRCYFYENIAWDWEQNPGNAIFLGESTATLNFCTIANSPIERIEEHGYDAIAVVLSELNVFNSVIWTGWNVGISAYHEQGEESSSTIRYSDIENGLDAVSRHDMEITYTDNIEDDPLYIDNNGGNHHLTADSPCIDAGDPDAPLDPDSTRADMGAFYFHQRDIDVDNNILSFEPIAWESVDSLMVSISNTGGNDLHLTDFLVPLHLHFFYFNEEIPFENPITILPDSTYQWWIFFHPQWEGEGEASFQASFMIESDDPDEPEIEVSVEGSVLSVEEEQILPSVFEQYPCFPNPFNSTTTIEYSLPFASEVTLSLYNLSGQRVETLVNGRLQAGIHRTMLDAGGMASGLYFLKLEGAGQSVTQKIMLVK